MAYSLTVYFSTEEEKEAFKLNIPKEVKEVAKPKYTYLELNKMLKADLIKLLLN